MKDEDQDSEWKSTMILTNHDLGYFGKIHEKSLKIIIFGEKSSKTMIFDQSNDKSNDQSNAHVV